MSKKSRKSRTKHKTGSSRKPSAIKEPVQVARVLPSLSRQTPVAKIPVSANEQTERHRYLIADLRRSLIIAGILIVLLILLKFLFG